jgi:hypothetical protein
MLRSAVYAAAHCRASLDTETAVKVPRKRHPPKVSWQIHKALSLRVGAIQRHLIYYACSFSKTTLLPSPLWPFSIPSMPCVRCPTW